MRDGVLMRLLKWILLAIAAWFVLMLGLGLAAKALLSEGRMRVLLARAESRVPVRISASGGGFSLSQWFRLRPAIEIRDLEIGNPQGFSSPNLLRAGVVSLQIRLPALVTRRVEVRALEIDRPELMIERDRGGRTNFAALLAALEQRAGGAGGSGGAGAAKRDLVVDRLRLTSGSIRYVEAGGRQPALTVRNIDLELSDFSASRACRILLAARPFDGKLSRFEFRGRAGPFRPESAPAEGDLALTLAPAEIPAAVRAEYFGVLLGEPGDAALLTLKTAMRGDLMGEVTGTGSLTLADLAIGKDARSRLAVSGQAPLAAEVDYPLARPEIRLATEGASLRLAQGSWKGSAAVRYDGKGLRGASEGSISGVRIEELLAAFGSTKQTVSGRAEIPRYELRFAGRNAAEIRDSLEGAGEVRLEEGRVALFDLLATIQKAANRLLAAEAPASGETRFTRLQSNVEIRKGQGVVRDILFENPVSDVTGQGRFGFDGSLDFNLAANITGELAGRLGGKPGAGGKPVLRVPVKVRGTTSSPKVYPDIGGMLKQKAVEKATGLIESLFKKKGEAPK